MTNFEKKVNDFIKELKNFKKSNNENNVFNPWADDDEKHDKNGDMPDKRRENLEQYLLKREKAEYLLIAEAPGYQGCHFSGIPMTSERLILTKNNYDLQDLNRTSDNTKLSKEKIYTEKYSNGRNIAKTVIKNGFAEPTATTVWKQMIDILKIEPNNFALWNAFPFHPYNNGYLSNRKPTEEEIKDTVKILENFINLFEYKKKIPFFFNFMDIHFLKVILTFFKSCFLNKTFNQILHQMTAAIFSAIRIKTSFNTCCIIYQITNDMIL